MTRGVVEDSDASGCCDELEAEVGEDAWAPVEECAGRASDSFPLTARFAGGVDDGGLVLNDCAGGSAEGSGADELFLGVVETRLRDTLDTGA